MLTVIICIGLLASGALSAAPAPPCVQSNNAGYGNERLFRTYFDPTPLPAMDAYPARYGLRGEALSRLRRDSADLYRGIAFLGSGLPAKALPYLEKAANNMKGTVSNASEWYLALTYLKVGKTAQAEYMFHKIAETEIHPYQDIAEVVYQQLAKRRK